MITISSKSGASFIAGEVIKKGELVKPSGAIDEEILKTAVNPTAIALNDANPGEPVAIDEPVCCSKITSDVVRGQFVKPDAAVPGKIKNSVTKDADVIGIYTKSVAYEDGNSEAAYLKFL